MRCATTTRRALPSPDVRNAVLNGTPYTGNIGRLNSTTRDGIINRGKYQLENTQPAARFLDFRQHPEEWWGAHRVLPVSLDGITS